MKEHIKLRQEGDELFKMNEYQDAIKKYQEALSYNTQYSTGYVHLAKALLALNNFDEAIQQCQKALGIKNDYAYAYLVEGDAHKLKAETLLSLKDFKVCSEECKKSEECYKTASKYHEDDYKTGTLRLSALEELENLLNISIASKSTATSTDEEFDFDPEENEEIDITQLATQKIVNIEITAEDILTLVKCIKNNNVEFIKEFVDKNSLTQEDACSLLLTQAIIEHRISSNDITQLFKLIEPSLTIFNDRNSHSLVSVLLRFGTRDDILSLQQYINDYEWQKVDLNNIDQVVIKNILSMGNPLEVTKYEYTEFVAELLGQIYSEQSVHDVLYE